MNKDYVIAGDTDSIFLPTLPLIELRYSGNDVDILIQKALEITTEIQTFANSTFNLYAKRFHNVTSHKWEVKQEMISKTAFFGNAKKRYAMHVINKKGLAIDEIDIKGFDAIRSDFPKDFRIFMKSAIIDILKGLTKDEMNLKVKAEKERIVKSANLRDILLPTGVKEISKFKYGQKGTPIHVKSAQNYNKLLELFKIENLPKIEDGDKILWAYLKPNSFGFETLAIRGYDDPDQIVEFLERFADRKMIFENRLLNKMQEIWNNLGWGRINLDADNDFF